MILSDDVMTMWRLLSYVEHSLLGTKYLCSTYCRAHNFAICRARRCYVEHKLEYTKVQKLEPAEVAQPDLGIVFRLYEQQ